MIHKECGFVVNFSKKLLILVTFEPHLQRAGFSATGATGWVHAPATGATGSATGWLLGGYWVATGRLLGGCWAAGQAAPPQAGPGLPAGCTPTKATHGKRQ